MAKKKGHSVKTIADASRCAAKVAAGQACTMAELKATVAVLNGALSTARATAKVAKREAAEAKEMLGKVLGRIGL